MAFFNKLLEQLGFPHSTDSLYLGGPACSNFSELIRTSYKFAISNGGNTFREPRIGVVPNGIPSCKKSLRTIVNNFHQD